MPRSLIARRFVLAAASLVFLAIAIGSLWTPHTMAEPFDYRLPSPNALNEFRAVYVGLWIAQAGVLAWAARRVDLLYLGDVGGILILGQVVGRILSVVIDGAPDARLLAPAAAELIAAVLIMLLRGRGPATPLAERSRAADRGFTRSRTPVPRTASDFPLDDEVKTRHSLAGKINGGGPRLYLRSAPVRLSASSPAPARRRRD